MATLRVPKTKTFMSIDFLSQKKFNECGFFFKHSGKI